MSLRLVPPSPPPASERVRKRVRATADRNRPRCTSCGGHEYIVAQNGRVRTKLCVVCLMQGRRREMIVYPKG